jgi:hypothetical protein
VQFKHLTRPVFVWPRYRVGKIIQVIKHLGAFSHQPQHLPKIPQHIGTWDALQAGSNALLEAPLERRIDVLIEDYLGDPDNRPALRAQLPFIEQRLGPVKWEGALVALLDAGRERELVQVLLERYYDPLYLHSERGRDYGLRVDTSDPTAAAEELAAWIEAQTLRRWSASPSRAWARSSERLRTDVTRRHRYPGRR